MRIAKLFAELYRERVVTDLMLYYKLTAIEASFWLAIDEEKVRIQAMQAQLGNILYGGKNEK